MIYSGSCCNAQALLSSCPAINLDTTRCDNPGDFIIDVLGLEDEDSEANDCSDLDQSFVSLHSVPSELDSFMKSPRKLKPDLCYELSSHFLQSSEYIMLLRAIEEDISILQRPLDLDFRDFGVFAEAPIHSEPPRSHSDKGMRERNGQGVNEGEEEEEEFLDDDDDNDEEKGPSSIAMHALASPEDRMVREFLASSQQDSVRSRPSFLLPSILSDADAGRTSRWAGNWLEVKVLQTWVLFARRVTVSPPLFPLCSRAAADLEPSSSEVAVECLADGSYRLNYHHRLQLLSPVQARRALPGPHQLPSFPESRPSLSFRYSC
jgi:hypothetical protein